MVLPWLAFWRAVNQLHEDGEHALLEHRGKIQFAASKKKNRRMHVVFALLLAWCLTMLMFSIRGGISSLPRYDMVEQLFPVRLLIKWDQATFESYPNVKKFDHSRIIRDIKEDVHSIVNSTISQSQNEVLSNTSITTSTISQDASDNSYDIEHNPLKSVDTSNDEENDVMQIETAEKKTEENFLRESTDEQYPVERNGRAITESIAIGENASDAQRDREENSDQEPIIAEKILNQNSIASDVKGELSHTDNSVDIRDQEISCDRTHWRTNVCVVKGDVRVKAKSVELHTTMGWNEKHVVETVKPYTRKWEMTLMGGIDEVRIESIDGSSLPSNQTRMVCDVKHSVPAIIFSTGGYTGNVYHDFSDGLIPMYITSRHLHGEVVFLVLDFHQWWLFKYGGVIRQLSHYPVVDLRNDHDTVRCFPEVTVGLKIHDELTVNADQMPNGGSIKDFNHILQHAFSSAHTPSSQVSAQKKPKLVLIARRGSRSISNQDAVVDLIKRVGFEVDVLEPNGGTKLEEIFNLLNSCDVMMGVHGAAMTHLLFMRPGTIFIQIIPLGTDGPALSFYGQPAMKLGLDYIEYKIKPQESSLSKQYKKTDRVLTNPGEIASKGWLELKKHYLDGQSVTPQLPRLKLTLQKALKRIKRRQ